MLADRVRMGSGSEKLDPSTWRGIRNIIRAGEASNYFDVGDELISLYDGREIIWQVIGIDVDTPSDSNYTHSMTIQTKDALETGQWSSAYDNRYINSNIRTYLNGSFLSKIDSELSAVIGLVNKKVAVRDSIGGQDSFADKVFLLSQKEVDLGGEGVTTGEFVYPFYDGNGNADRIKYRNGTTSTWWLRSPRVSSSYEVFRVSQSGTLGYGISTNVIGLSPACVII
jgi:hypothetical protein